MTSLDNKDNQDHFAKWTNTVNINVRCILSEDKKQTVLLKVNTNDKAMVVAE